MKLSFSSKSGQAAAAMAAHRVGVAAAATGAVKDVADQVKARARSRIAAAGFSKRWQNAMRVDVYPKGGRTSIDAAMFAHHDIAYAGVFEKGATIKGSPLLWLPLPSAPKKVGGRRLTAGNYQELIGSPLFVIARPGRPPLLAANVNGKAGEGDKAVTPGQLRRGARAARRQDAKIGFGGKIGRAPVRALPLFIGVPRVKLRARFGLSDIFAAAPRQLASAFARRIERLG